VVPFTVETLSSTTRFIEGESTELYCQFGNISVELINIVSWFHNNKKLEITEVRLEISSLNHTIHNGIYYCQVNLYSGSIYSMKSNNTVLVMIECKFESHFAVACLIFY
jgi:hypothetical protein